jgi:hypothetical protein
MKFFHTIYSNDNNILWTKYDVGEKIFYFPEKYIKILVLGPK